MPFVTLLSGAHRVFDLDCTYSTHPRLQSLHAQAICRHSLVLVDVPDVDVGVDALPTAAVSKG